MDNLSLSLGRSRLLLVHRRLTPIVRSQQDGDSPTLGMGRGRRSGYDNLPICISTLYLGVQDFVSPPHRPLEATLGGSVSPTRSPAPPCGSSLAFTHLLGLEVGEASYEVPTAGVLRADVLAGNRSGGKPLPLSAGRVPRTGSDDPFSQEKKRTSPHSCGAAAARRGIFGHAFWTAL